jgi:hypothetical protein
MLDAATGALSVGPPLIATEALSALRDLIDALRDERDNASSLESLPEGLYAATTTPRTECAVESCPSGKDA